MRAAEQQQDRLGALLFLALVIYVPPFANAFRFAPLGLLDVALCLGAGVFSVAWFEILKWSGLARRAVAPAVGKTRESAA
ncbi:MAG: cation transporting ATPase C-terminal domain-containing protein [Polyangiales bacterium]